MIGRHVFMMLLCREPHVHHGVGTACSFVEHFSDCLTSWLIDRITFIVLLLIIHAGASRVGRVLPLSEIFQTISEKNRRRSQIWHTNVPRWVLETHLFWGQKVKSQGHEAQIQVYVGLQTERNIDACCVKGKERKRIYIAPFIYYVYLKAFRHGSHSFTCKYTMLAFPSYAFTRWRHL